MERPVDLETETLLTARAERKLREQELLERRVLLVTTVCLLLVAVCCAIVDNAAAAAVASLASGTSGLLMRGRGSSAS